MNFTSNRGAAEPDSLSYQGEYATCLNAPAGRRRVDAKDMVKKLSNLGYSVIAKDEVSD